ncbi:Methyltransferase domain-containing protein [Evansella caseinilytica]|uniref:Methyltransferase domain-containing protein n=1 Tax=Evansella caseinilytica TaxID=1503961 RepID=A0A1H3KBT9_9BACI|nr:methyltransferase domain-containing protein [Evansella caseinilytica]SDY49636.1 Methyltransferase domain-containing protein [Evansella caseinilytica]
MTTVKQALMEKIDPMNGRHLEHIARYQFAVPFVKGRVLDLSCCNGYESKLLAKAGKKAISEIIAVVTDKEAVAYAENVCYHPLLSFRHGSITDDNYVSELGKFDTIVGFDTIRETEDRSNFMEQIHRLLTPEGTVLLSASLNGGNAGRKNTVFNQRPLLTPEQFRFLFVGFQETAFYGQTGVLFEPSKPAPDIEICIGIGTGIR